MTQPTARQIEMAKQCQLITGSYEGKDPCCPCITRSECRFSLNQRIILSDMAEIKLEKDRQVGKYHETIKGREAETTGEVHLLDKGKREAEEGSGE